MNRQVIAVVAGFTRLSPADRAEAIKQISRFSQANEQLRKSITEEIRGGERMELGPIEGGCPCCGR
jgi:hypothetical protein